ncbi:Pleckstrin (PH) domain-containing protein isoform 1 [Capsicum annuum]|nr:Pleckstrin (PH) domain-containing protein isoform 1 [Capsicum annuum]
MGGTHVMKRIPRIKFPRRHPKPSSGSTQQNSQHMKTSSTDDVPRTFFSRSPSSTAVAGKASDQPKRTPVSQEEIEAICWVAATNFEAKMC